MTQELPELCYRCGIEEAQDVWITTSKERNLSPLSAVTFLAGFTVYNVRTHKMAISVCKNCKNRLERDVLLKRWCTVAGGVVAGISLLGFTMLKDSLRDLAGILFLASLAFVVI